METPPVKTGWSREFVDLQRVHHQTTELPRLMAMFKSTDRAHRKHMLSHSAIKRIRKDVRDAATKRPDMRKHLMRPLSAQDLSISRRLRSSKYEHKGFPQPAQNPDPTPPSSPEREEEFEVEFLYAPECSCIYKKEGCCVYNKICL